MSCNGKEGEVKSSNRNKNMYQDSLFSLNETSVVLIFNAEEFSDFERRLISE